MWRDQVNPTLERGLADPLGLGVAGLKIQRYCADGAALVGASHVEALRGAVEQLPHGGGRDQPPSALPSLGP